ncbi:unnamed protein product [Phyllotreta striolata]|uniref:BZIP domain-containing protein n=1 Tax=Phyllotreta striolata TaxID=444603 RepID=A0A9P0GR87_PHYSR|nr:unnamed protein product [Phyllotreta striolata]
MLTTDDFSLDDYVFKSSPESCNSYSDHSYSTDCMDVACDEDFLTQLSSDLNIPLLLNQGEDELSILNSLLFDENPEEILPEPTVDVSRELLDLQKLDFSKWPSNGVKNEPVSPRSSKSNSPVCPDAPIIKEEIVPKSPPASPIIVNNVNELPNNVVYPVKIVQKHVPIVPKTPYPLPIINKNNLVVLNGDLKPVVTQPPNVVLMDNLISSVPVTKPVTVSSVLLEAKNRFTLNGRSIDPKILKRQQRKIKNRESASLSRKKKKDYVTSLEEQVKELTSLNKRLQSENIQLKEKLAQYEINPLNINGSRSIKPSLFLCICLIVLGLNFNIMRNPFSVKTQVDDPLPLLNGHHGRSLLWTTDDVNDKENKTSAFSKFFMCPATINQTESARLVLELERWIGKPSSIPKNTSLDQNKTNNIKKSRPRKKKYRLENSLTSYKRYRYKDGREMEAPTPNELQVFSVRPDHIYSEFFEAINKQDDTFYVVSFTDQHLLLPALHHNKTRRPKMSLIMPSIMPNAETVSKASMIPLMQIDCEVLDTRLLHIKHGSIPMNFRTFGNATKKEAPEASEVGNNTDKRNYYKSNYKPYFVKPSKGIFKLN